VAALGAWSRRANITADRAGLLCVRDVDGACAALVKAALPEPHASPSASIGDEAYQMVSRREAALRVFAESSYFHGVMGEAGGQPAETCDARVAEILSKGTGSREPAAAEEPTPPSPDHDTSGPGGPTGPSQP
jgi:hypothetical protein